MSIKYSLSILTGLVLTLSLLSCSETAKTPMVEYDHLSKSASLEPPAKSVKIITVPKPLPLPGQLKKKPVKTGRISLKKKTGYGKPGINEVRKKALIEPSDSSYINAMQVYPYTKGALYRLYAAVNQITDIALQPGEQLQSVSAGDTVRWIVGDTTSGSGPSVQSHIQIKPVAPDLQTNLIISTNRRTYHLEMISDAETYMSSISWTYAGDQLIALKKKNRIAIEQERMAIQSGILPENLKFRYRITGKAPWKPVRVFDDGQKVYIQFPSGIRQGEAPPLFVLGEKGKLSLVNYRMKHPYYIVDRLFAAAELRHGEVPQTRIRITRTDAIWKEENGL